MTLPDPPTSGLKSRDPKTLPHEWIFSTQRRKSYEKRLKKDVPWFTLNHLTSKWRVFDFKWKTLTKYRESIVNMVREIPNVYPVSVSVVRVIISNNKTNGNTRYPSRKLLVTRVYHIQIHDWHLSTLVRNPRK